ncbi:alpha/beta fold hydrolase [Actinomycetes bacterium KLBMP 9759]
MRTFSFHGNDGCSLHSWAVGAGPTLLLLHGGGPDHRSLIPLAERLADRHTVVLPDIRGYGESVCTDPAQHTWAQYTHDVIALLDHLDVQEAVLVGTGLGSTIALRVARDHPDRVRAAILISAEEIESAEGKQAETALLDAFANRVRDEGLEAAWDPVLTLFPPVIATMVRDAIPRSNPESIAAAAAIARDRAFPDIDAVATIDVPVLVIPGTDARHPAELGETLAATLPHGELAPLAITDSMHTPDDLASAVAPAVRAFLTDTTSLSETTSVEAASPIRHSHPDAQRRVQLLLDALVASGREVGAQVAVYHDGRLVVDAWAGVAQPSTGVPVDGQTLFPVFSVGKGIAATALHVLVDHGLVGYETRLAQFWPEFAVHGKDATTLANVLDHSAGVPYFPMGLSADDLLDADRIAGLIADMEPEWKPGTLTGYHILTFGYLVAETIRRATGASLADVVRNELAAPLGIDEDLFVVPPAAHAHRLADIDADEFVALQSQLPGGSALVRVVGGLSADAIVPRRQPPPGRSWSMEAPLPFSATMTARAGARLYAMLAGGGEIDGVRLLSSRAVATATEIRRSEVDQILGAPVLKSWGYVNGDPVTGARPAAFGFGGLGGAEAYADPEHRLSFAFTHNLLTPPTREDSAPEVAAEVRAALGIQ